MAKQKSDFAQITRPVVEQATGENLKPRPEKNAAAVALGHLGGLMGGPKRMEKIGNEGAIGIARKGAAARWEKAKAQKTVV
jgi:hypothetical protein